MRNNFDTNRYVGRSNATLYTLQYTRNYDMRHSISFLINSAANGEQENWTVHINVMSAIEPLSTSSLSTFGNVNMGNLFLEEYFIFTIRYIPKLHRKLRIYFDERMFVIKRIVDLDERKKFLKIIAMEVNAK